MKSRVCGKRVGVFLLGGLLAATSAVAAGEFQLGDRTFTLPEGFTIERVAGPPLVDRPITADFDEEGRLYVTDSSGSNDPVAKQVVERPHRIVRLEDTDGDGRFDKHTVFAQHMMFPEGTMWLDGSLYVSAPPSIWKLTDTDGDGAADEQVEWFRGKTLTGCANDLHGPYRGPDGWIYWCKGAFAKQTYERPGKPPFVTRAAHIFRCRPDGSGLEHVMTGGMDNPVDVVFTPGGERIFTTTFFQHPAAGRRDGLIHAVYGGVYGKVHDVIDEHKRTSPEVLPVLVHLGPAAPCGLARYESAVFGPEYQDNLFACNFNLQKITRHVLAPSGATFVTRDEDFLVSPDKDFHPTDIQADADGSLVVVDTGGWYKLCCPTSQLHKPDVLGGIYRVKKTGAPRVADPRGRTIAWSDLSVGELVRLLDDPRPAVRLRATEALGDAGEETLELLASTLRPDRAAEARRNAVWAATRIEGPAARRLVRQALDDADESVRQVALHSVSLHRDAGAEDRLLALVRGASAQNARAAAEALGRIGSHKAVPVLFELLSQPRERVLEHSLTYALIEIADAKATAAGLAHENVRVRRAALVALDQMDGGGLEPSAVVPGLTSNEPAIREVSTWIVSRHPEWAGALSSFLRERLASKDLSAADRVELTAQLARFAHHSAIQTLLAERLDDPDTSREGKLLVLQSMSQAGLKEVPTAWPTALVKLLDKADEPALLAQAVATARSWKVPRISAKELAEGLCKLGENDALAVNLRLEALAAVPEGQLPVVSPAQFDLLVDQLAPERPLGARSSAADVVAKARLDQKQLERLVEVIRSAGPLEMERLLPPFARTHEEEIGLKLVAALGESNGTTNLKADTIKARLEKYNDRVHEAADKLYEKLSARSAQQQKKLEGLLASIGRGDVRRGQAVFNSQKAACISCHTIGYLGGKVGPDLTRIGLVRNERDLLESIVFPSASFVRSYEPVAVATQDGKVLSGILKKDAADEVVLVTSATEEARIPRGDVEEMQPGTVSVMPAGLDQQLSEQELLDLVAFLRECKR